MGTLTTGAHSQLSAGLDTWADYCGVTDRDLLQLAEAEAAMFNGFVVPNLDGTYHLERQPFSYIPEYGSDYQICAGSKFEGEPRPDGFPAGRSAFLVGPDLVLTANHGFGPGDLPVHDFVFGLHQHLDARGRCVGPNLDHIPAADVYRAAEVVAHGGPLDFLLVRLDRPVVGRPILRVRRSGAVGDGDRATVVGHPEMLPTKVDLAGIFRAGSSYPWAQDVLVSGVHTLIGSSGSMIYNRDRQMVESVVRTLACARFDLADGCYKLASDCSGGPYPLGHPIALFASHIPAFELVVDSLADVVHVAAEGGPLADEERRYTIAAPKSASRPIAYHVEPPVQGEAGPNLELTLDGPYDGNLQPGETRVASTKASIAGVPCGTYERSFVVEDRTHGFRDRLRHRFEIGIAEFVTTPPVSFAVADLAPPYEATMAYEVRNPRPTPVTITVGTDRDWITLNGLAAPGLGVPPTLSLTLAAAGEPGERATVVVGIGGSASSLPLGVRVDGTVAFTNATGSCDDRGSTTRNVSFLPGQAELSSGLGVVAVPDGDPRGIASKISLPEHFCVADIDISVRTLGANANDLTVEVVSPQGTTVRLWDHHGLDETDIRRSFDDATAPSPTGELLARFNGEAGAGTWVLQVSDDTPGGENALAFWSLKARSFGTPRCGSESAAGSIAAASGVE